MVTEAEKELKDKVDLSGADIAADHIYMAMYLEEDVSGYNSGMLSQYESVLTEYGFTVEEVQQLLAAITIKVNVSFENAVTYCEDCKSEYETVKYGKICPKCGSRHTYLLRGSEFNIKEIEAC